MKRFLMTTSVLALLLLAGCAASMLTYTDGDLTVSYPDWARVGSEDVAVQKADCRVSINLEAEDFNVENLEAAVDNSFVPSFEELGLSVQSSVAGSEAVLTYTGPATGKTKLIVCNDNLYVISAACQSEKAIVDQVISSVSC